MRTSLLFFGFLFLSGWLRAQPKNMGMYAPADPAIYYLSTQTDYAIPFHLRYLGPSHATQIRYSYSLNGGQPVKQQAVMDPWHPVSCVQNLNIAIYRIAFNTPLHFTTPGNYDLKIWIDSLDGLPDSNPANDTMVRHYRVFNNLPVRKGLTEYGYHMTCGPCGESGTPYLDQLLSQYEDFSVLVKLHNYTGSPPISFLNCPESIAIDQMFGDLPHPKFTFNRADIRPYANPNFEEMIYSPDIGFCPTNYNYFMRDINMFNKVPVELEALNPTLDNATQQLSLTMQATFPADITFAREARLSCMLVEDSIYAYQYDNGLPGIDSAWHRYVLRAVLGGSFGKAGSLPANVQQGETYPLTLTTTLKPEWNRKRLYVIPTLQYYGTNANQREILNVTRIKLPYFPLTETNTKLRAVGGIYATTDPGNGTAALVSDGEMQIQSATVFSMEGKKWMDVPSGQPSKRFQFSVRNLPRGCYLVQTTLSDGRLQTVRMLLE